MSDYTLARDAILNSGASPEEAARALAALKQTHKAQTAAANSAAAELARLRAAETTYLGYLQYLYPTRRFAPFQLQTIDILDRLEKRTLIHPSTGAPVRNVLLTMPPRHGKSEYGTRYFPSYFMGRDPRRFVMTSSYNAQLAKGFGRYTRQITRRPEFARIFPNFQAVSDTRAADHWATSANGAYFGVGLDGTTSGRPANCLVIDDPIKSRPDAESPTIRDKVWDYYASALATRLQPEEDGAPPIQIVILTRWHPDDLAGRLMELEEWHQGQWLHVDFPALTGDFADPTSLTALWPERFPVTELLRIRRRNEREFESLYQQSPFLKGGNLIHTDWFGTYTEPDDQYLSVVIAADTAFQNKTSADYSAIIIGGVTRNGDIHILDVIRKKIEFPELKKELIVLNALWRGRGLRAIYIEDKASGQSLIQELRRESGLAVIPHKPGHTDKVARVNGVLPLIEGGRVFLPAKAPWLADFLAELSQFPGAKHDDQVDALTILLDTLSRFAVSPDAISLAFDQALSLNSLATSFMQKSLAETLNAPGTRGRPWGQGQEAAITPIDPFTGRPKSP